MRSQILPLKCQQPNCQRRGGTIEILPNGEKVLTLKNNRHDGQIHEQNFSLEEIIKQYFTFDEIRALFGK